MFARLLDWDRGRHGPPVAAVRSQLLQRDLYLADIPVPRAVYQAIGLEVGPIFAGSDLIRI